MLGNDFNSIQAHNLICIERYYKASIDFHWTAYVHIIEFTQISLQVQLVRS